MIETLGALWTFLVRVAGDLGDLWQSATVCLLLSLAFTQWLKPEMALVDAVRRRRILQTTAFLSAFVPMAVLHPDKRGVVIGLLVGIASPTLYRVVLFVLHHRVPSLAAALSSDMPHYSVADFIAGKKPENTP
jgi:hypothetical protein